MGGFSITAFQVSTVAILNRQGSFRMHMGERWRVDRVGICFGGFLVLLDVSGPEPERHIPFSG